MFGNDDFMNFMGYRNMVVEDKIEECLSAARRGETSISIDSGDLTDSEIDAIVDYAIFIVSKRKKEENEV